MFNQFVQVKLPTITFLLTGLIFLSCSNTEGGDIDKIVEGYYQTYNKRQNFKKLLTFYDEKIVLEDIINGDRIIGKEELEDFLDWSNPNFERLDSNNLIIEEIIIDDNVSVIKGYFSRFKWGQSEFEAMHFTTILTFNKSKKIVKQVDWINYPATLVNYSKRKNSNKWIE